MASRLVFDSASRSCPKCKAPLFKCKCHKPAHLEGDGIVRLRREVRRGKTITVADGVPLAGAELKALGKHLKQMCGSGGSTSNGVIEIQGEHRDAVEAELVARGMTVKRAGG